MEVNQGRAETCFLNARSSPTFSFYSPTDTHGKNEPEIFIVGDISGSQRVLSFRRKSVTTVQDVDTREWYTPYTTSPHRSPSVSSPLLEVPAPAPAPFCLIVGLPGVITPPLIIFIDRSSKTRWCCAGTVVVRKSRRRLPAARRDGKKGGACCCCCL